MQASSEKELRRARSDIPRPVSRVGYFFPDAPRGVHVSKPVSRAGVGQRGVVQVRFLKGFVLQTQRYPSASERAVQLP